MSDNKVKTVDNRGAAHLGYHPEDSAEPFRAAVEAKTPVVAVGGGRRGLTVRQP